MDPNQTTEMIKVIGAILTPIATGIIVLLQIKANKKQAIIHAQINGMKDQLVAAEKGLSRQEGKEEQRAEDKAEGKQVTPSVPIVGVKIVDQDKPVEVVTKKPGAK